MLAGCSHQSQRDFMQRMAAHTVGKTAVFSMSGDAASQREEEAEAVIQLRKIGIDAAEGHQLVAGLGECSAADIVSLLTRNGFKSVTELRPKQDSNEVAFELHYLEDADRAHAQYSQVKVSAVVASQMLLETLFVLAKSR